MIPSFRIRRIFLSLIVSWVAVSSGFAQDPVFSQFYAAPIHLNPAFAGNTNAPFISVNYRNQWPDLERAYVTYAVSYDQAFRKYNSGIGISVLQDEAGNGLIKTTRASLIYMYKMQLSDKWYAKAGLELTGFRVSYDWGRLVFPDQLDQQFGAVSPGGTPYPTDEAPPDDPSAGYIDFSFGGLAYSRNLYVGFSIKHLNTPDERILDTGTGFDNGLPIKYVLQAGADIPLGRGNNLMKDPFFSPNVLFVRQANFYQLNVGAFAGFSTFFAGLAYRYAGRNADALITSVGFRKGMYRLAYSFDYTVSSLGIQSGGAHELSFQLRLDALFPEKTDYNDCFQLFR